MPDISEQSGNPAAPPMGATPAPAPVGAGTAPGQPPFGSSPVSQPTPNKGHEAAGLSRLAVIVQLMTETVPLLGASSEPGQALLKALNALAKHAAPGSVSPGVQQSTMERLLAQQKQMGPQIAAMRAGPPNAPPAGA